ncbi:unnamed protein product [Vicia faba]|uniref:Uncharacterized protein n=1 Tax=Vicia faba TaxID=3906 RepID=A0AAV1ANG2_VICFA|nr:unnamed protein product [Vicia faba]
MGESETTMKTIEKENFDISRKDEVDDDPKINYRGWKVMPYIIGNEIFEKLGAIGTLANLLVYLTTVFNLDNVTAANIINIFHGSTNFSTLLGAFFSDTFFGRYNTLAVCSVFCFLGLFGIELTALIKNLHPPQCEKESATCKGPTTGQMFFLTSSFVIMIIGSAGVRPCSLAFGVDQFNPKTESRKKGINSFFNWYFFTLTFAQMVSLTGIVYIQSNVSWVIGLGIPTSLMFIACVVFFVGTKLYVRLKPNGSPIKSIIQVLVVAVKKRRLKVPSQHPLISLFDYVPPNSLNLKISSTNQFRVLDKAAIITPRDKINPDGSPADPWSLCSIQQVEELKCLVRVLPILFSGILFFLSITQQQTFLVFQALQSDRRVGSNFNIPGASYIVILMLSMTIWLAIYDRILVPFFRRFTGKEAGITLLQRVGVGIFLSIISMLVSAVVEIQRRRLALSNPIGILPRKGAISSMLGYWLVPQLILAGVSEAFTAVGLTEFYYEQFPENMKTIAGSLFFCGMAGSSYLSAFLVSVVHKTTSESATGNWLSEDLNKGRLEYFYFLIAAIEVFNFGYFLICSKWFKYRETSTSSIGNA